MLRKVILSAILAVTTVGICAQGGNVDTTKPTPVTGKPKKTSSGVSYWDIQEGTGATAKKGQTVTVNYTGWLENGKKFDSSVGKRPLQFTLLSGVIQGWIDGIQGMKVGGKRQLKIPSELGYGSRGAGNGVIPPNATLIFDVELLSIDSK
jgi:FKBP-type peptidyl-prolyl cis-trans isomerase